VNQTDIPFLTATELSRLIKAKEISPVETMEAYLDRIDEINPKLNAYITVCRDEAIAQAKESEQALFKDNDLGPLHGVPVAIKDQIWTKGVLTTAGSNILRDFVPDQDATVVSKLRGAGAILVGKTNMTEFAITTNSHFPYGMNLNPWDLSRYPGSSSGGSAAATAASLCGISLGEDTGGSVRGPAASCGIAGLRPSYGLVSRYGLIGACWSKDIIGPMTRTVADCALTLQAISGYDPKDRYTHDRDVPAFTDELSGNIKGLRVGVITNRVYTDDVAPEVRDAVVKAIEDLKSLGTSVSEISLPMITQTAAFSLVGEQVEAVAGHRQYMKDRLSDYQHELRLTLLVSSLIPGQIYYKSLQLRDVWRTQMLEAFNRVDVLVLPTSPTVAATVPPATGLSSKADMKENFFGRRSFTHPASLAGCPALSVNCGFTVEGLPVGLQLVGRPFEDGVVLRVGHAYEQATDWHKRRPPV